MTLDKTVFLLACSMETVVSWHMEALTFKITYPVTFEVSHLDLQQWKISKDLQIVFVPFKSIPVALDGLVILLIRALKQTIHVPTWRKVKDRTAHCASRAVRFWRNLIKSQPLQFDKAILWSVLFWFMKHPELYLFFKLCCKAIYAIQLPDN